ncbi:MAG: helix-turn-helix domain-containing protein [bacterium]|nr:helix-turn-helix domain-containing protein [bacterium]
MSKTVPIQSIKRALDLLDLLAEEGLGREGLTLQTIARHLNIAAPTAHNILRTMSVCGYIEQDREHRYRLGSKCRDMVRSVALSGALLNRVSGIIHLLAEETGEAVVLATLVNGRRRVVLRAASHQLLRVDPSAEKHNAMFEVVTGRVLAAFASPDELEVVIEVNGLPGKLWKGISDRETLIKELGLIREQRLDEECLTERGTASLCVPVLDAEGRILAAIGIHLPAFRAGEERMIIIRAATKKAAERIESIWK